MKLCKTCKIEKPITEFAKNKNCAGGHLTECKQCNKIYRQEHALHRASVEMQRRRKNGVQPKKIYSSDEERRLAHLDTCKQWNARNVDNRREYRRLYHEANKSRRYILIRQWREQNQWRLRLASANRRAAIARATPGWADLSKLSEIYIHAQELSSVTGIPHQVDHFYPINGKTVCGLHVVENLQVISKQENLNKAASHPDDFYV